MSKHKEKYDFANIPDEQIIEYIKSFSRWEIVIQHYGGSHVIHLRNVAWFRRLRWRLIGWKVRRIC